MQGDDVAIDDVNGVAKGPNDRALLAVLEGKADAMWIYGDQASAAARCPPPTARTSMNQNKCTRTRHATTHTPSLQKVR